MINNSTNSSNVNIDINNLPEAERIRLIKIGQRIKNREYQKRWREKNKAKVIEYRKKQRELFRRGKENFYIRVALQAENNGVADEQKAG